MASTVRLPEVSGARGVARTRVPVEFIRANGAVVFIYMLALLLAIVASALNPTFRDLSNATTILRQSIVLGLVAIGQTLVILTGGIDMSVGMVARITALVIATLFAGNPALVLPLVALGLLIGAGIGAVNGLVITRINANPFIVTLGMFGILEGVSLAVASGPVGLIPDNFLHVYDAQIAGVPICVLGMAVIWFLAWLAVSRTAFGRALYAVGGSPVVARLSAIPVRRTVLLAYVISGMCGAAAGLFILARMGVGDPSTGYQLEFQSIVAVALGGTSLYGGKGSMVGTLGAVILLSLITNVFDILQVNVFYQQLLLGLIVLVAVAVHKTGKTV
jgi:ribose transport system permease protein